MTMEAAKKEIPVIVETLLPTAEKTIQEQNHVNGASPAVWSPLIRRRISSFSSRPSSPRVRKNKEILTASISSNSSDSSNYRRQSAPVIRRLSLSPRIARRSVGAKPDTHNNTEEERRRNFQDWLQNKVFQQKREKELQFLEHLQEIDKERRAHIQGTKTYVEWCTEVAGRLSLEQKKAENERLTALKQEEISEKQRHKRVPLYAEWLDNHEKQIDAILADVSLTEHEKIKHIEELKKEKSKVTQSVYQQWVLAKENEELQKEKQLLELAKKPPPKPKLLPSVTKRRQSLVQVPPPTRRASSAAVPTRKTSLNN